VTGSRDWTPSQEFEEYSLVRRLGRGGMGEVYLAHDTLLDRAVAIKFMVRYHDAVARERFLVEARAAARLQHPNVVSVYRIGEIDGRPYIASEFVQGVSLDELETPVPWPRMLEIGRELTRGLAAAHRRGVLHRDIKPANAMITNDGEVKLLDFGLAKLAARTDAHESAPPGETAGESLDRADAALAQTVRTGSDGRAAADPAATTTVARPTSSPDVGATWTGAPGSEEEPDADKASSPASPSPALTRAGAVMGTPYYMAPEVWRAEPATPRTDVYSMGALLYALCTGRPPHRGTDPDELGRIVNQNDAPPVAESVEGIDPRFAAVIDRCLSRDPKARFASATELWDALEEIAATTARGKAPEGNPYRGLLPFEAEHRSLFFGRGSDIRVVVERLRTEPFLLIAGDSGVGKSSLCRAGVAPAIAEDGLADGRTWTVATMVPGRRPVRALASALSQILGVEAGTLTESPAALATRLRAHCGSSAGVLLFVDQLEELITLADKGERETMCSMLAELVERAPHIRVLATVRGDYLTRLAALPEIGSEIARAVYLLRPLGEEAMREIILGPARATGVRFESNELVDTLIEACAEAEGSLPLLQFTLAELWDARDIDARITSAALEELGGVGGALAGHADGVLKAMLPEPRAAARRILVRLVTLHGTRARGTAAELAATAGVGRTALEALVHGRLLVAREVEGDTVYEVAHEALLSHWGALREWIDDEADQRAARARIADATAEWTRLGQSREALWRKRQLEEVRGVDAAALSDTEQEFLRRSRRLMRRNRWLIRGAAVGAVLAVVGVYAGVTLRARWELDRKIAQRMQAARSALAEARQLGEEAATSRREAFRLFDAEKKEDAETTWKAAATASDATERAYARAGQLLELALDLDPRRRSVRSLVADVLYERTLLAERRSEPRQRDELLERLALYDESSERRRKFNAAGTVSLRTTPAGAAVTLWRYVTNEDRVRTPEPVTAPGAAPFEVSLPPGSYLVAVAAPARAAVRYPFVVGRGERLDLALELPRSETVPDGFVYVAPGRFQYGSGQHESVRIFETATPIHQRETGAFAIAQHETTYSEWLTYLESLPGEQRRAQLQQVAATFRGRLELSQLADDKWQLTLQPEEHTYRAVTGEKLTYLDRAVNASQNWLRFPVTGVTWQEAEEYTRWLAATGRVPGARLCREDEWERAARGADDRIYPHGDALASSAANFDATYGRKPQAFGPDEVGTHPASCSPFGLDDMTGNAFEMARSVQVEGEKVTRGGAFYYDSGSATTTNRWTIAAGTRDLVLGFRVCADLAAN